MQAVGLRIRGERLEVDLADGRRVSVPIGYYPTLARASAAQRRAWEYWPMGTAIEWPQLDLQLSVASIVAGRRERVAPQGWKEDTSAKLAAFRARQLKGAA